MRYIKIVASYLAENPNPDMMDFIKEDILRFEVDDNQKITYMCLADGQYNTHLGMDINDYVRYHLSHCNLTFISRDDRRDYDCDLPF